MTLYYVTMLLLTAALVGSLLWYAKRYGWKNLF